MNEVWSIIKVIFVSFIKFFLCDVIQHVLVPSVAYLVCQMNRYRGGDLKFCHTSFYDLPDSDSTEKPDRQWKVPAHVE